MTTRRIFSLIVLAALGLPLLAQPRTLTIPHVTRADGGFETYLIIENDWAIPQKYTVYHYTETGAPVTLASDTVAAHGRLHIDARALTEEGAPPYLRVELEDGLRAGVDYARQGEPAARAYVAATETPSRRWMIPAGKWDEAFDGVALVNEEPEAVAVALIQRDEAGSEIARVSNALTAPANGKALFLLSDYFQPVAGATVEIVADGRISALGLRGSLAGATTDYLVGNTAQRLTSFPKELEALHVNREKFLAAVGELGGAYVFEYQLQCFCDPATVRPVSIEAANGQIADVRYVDDQAMPPISALRAYRTIEELFTQIEETLAQEPAEVWLEFDETYGYPTVFALDWDRRIADEGFRIEIANLRGAQEE